MTDLEKAKGLLSENADYTCVLCGSDEVITSCERGVKPLFTLIENGMDIRSFSAADKVVGRATAFLYVLLGIRAVYARVLSRPALEVLQNARIKTEYGILSDNIINRAGDGICPFETAVLGIDSPNEAFDAIKEKLLSLGIIIKGAKNG